MQAISNVHVMFTDVSTFATDYMHAINSSKSKLLISVSMVYFMYYDVCRCDKSCCLFTTCDHTELPLRTANAVEDCSVGRYDKLVMKNEEMRIRQEAVGIRCSLKVPSPHSHGEIRKTARSSLRTGSIHVGLHHEWPASLNQRYHYTSPLSLARNTLIWVDYLISHSLVPKINRYSDGESRPVVSHFERDSCVRQDNLSH